MKKKQSKKAKMMKGYTHIAILLDRSGSMASVKDDTIGGFNQFLLDQQKEKGKATMTVVQFDSQNPYEVLTDFKDIKDVEPLSEASYEPRATTPLLDALGRCINDIQSKIDALADKDKPEKTIVVVITDGLENASREFSRTQVLEMITAKEKAKWKFVYLGAHSAAFSEAGGIGISRGSTLSASATSAGITMSFMSASRGMSDYRSAPSAAAGQSMDYFNAADREAQDKEGANNKQAST